MSLRLLRLMTVCIIAILPLSCTAHYKLYEGDTILPSEVAILVKSPVSGVYLYEVDGGKAPDAKGMWKPWYGSKWNGGFRIELLPGEHTLSVAYNDGAYRSMQKQRITFDARPDQTYTVMASIDKKNMRWNSWVAEIESSSKEISAPKGSPETEREQRGLTTEKSSQEQTQQSESPNDFGIISITSDPPGAKIFIDGEFKSETPAAISLNTGTYQLFLQRQLYEPYKESVTIEKGQTKTLNIKMSPEADGQR